MSESSKPFWASKTLWVNLLAGIAAISGAFSLDLGLDQEMQAQIVVGITAAANFALRLVTDTPVKASNK